MPGASEMELVDTWGKILCCSLWPSGSAQENTEVSNGTLFRIRSSIAAQMWAPPARTARRVHRHSRAGRALRAAPTCERIGQNMCFPSCLREGPDRRFCGQTSQKNFQGFRVERVGLRAMRSSFVECVSAPRISRSIAHHGQCRFHLD